MKGGSHTLRRAMRLSTIDGIFAVQYTTVTSATLLTTFLLALGAGAFQIGLVAAFPLLAGLVQPVGAELIRRRGGWRRSVCVAAAVVETALWGVSFAAVLLLDAVQAVGVVIGVLALQYLANAFVAVGWTSWMSDIVPLKLRGRYFGRRNFICNALGAVTAVAAGQIVRQATPGEVEVYLWLIAGGIAARCVSVFVLSRQPEPVPAQSVGGGFGAQLAQPFRHKGFRSYLVYSMVWGFAMQLAAPFFTVYMVRDLKVGVETAMLLAGLSTVANLLGQRFWGPMLDRYGDRQVQRVVVLTLALQPVWWLFTSASGPGFYLMLLLGVTGGFATGGNLLATGNLTMRLAPELGKTSFFAVQAALGGAAGALGPLTGGALAAALAAGFTPLPGWLFEGLKTLFVLSGVLRLAAWGLLHRVPEPVGKPRLRTVVLLRDVARTFNPGQGFSPLLHVFVPARVERRPARHRRRVRRREG